MQYPTFQSAGWPIGSGMVESAGHSGLGSASKKGRLTLNPTQHHQPHGSLAQRRLQCSVVAAVWFPITVVLNPASVPYVSACS